MTRRFRWAYCQLESLKQLRSTREKSVEDALRCLPADLDATYERMLARIDSYSLEEALTMLRWLTFGTTSLTLGELQEARLTCPAEDGTVAWDDPGSIQDIMEILGDLILVEEPSYVTIQQPNWRSQAPRARIACESFQAYVTEHGGKAMTSLEEADRKILYVSWLSLNGKQFCNVRLAHFSVKEYLLSGRITHQLCDGFNLQRSTAREFLAQSCLVYLVHYSACNKRRATATDFATFPLLRHAAFHWSAYVVHDTARPLRHELRFLQDHEARVAWVRVLTSNQGVWDQTRKPEYVYGTALYFACSLEHRACVEWLLKETVDVNALAGPFNTALQVASLNGHQTIVDMLLKQGADPNVLRELSLAYTVTALCAAATHGQYGIVKLLLANGADPNISSDVPFRMRPLYAASEGGHTEIVASLLEAGAEVSHYGDHRGTAIRIAAEKGFDPIVKLLLRAGSGVDDVDDITSLTSLNAALHAGHRNVAKRLIKSQALVTIPDGVRGLTALERAAEKGYNDLLELMLEIGVGADWPVVKSYALLAAIRYGHLSCVRVLVQHGTSVHASRIRTFFPLDAACLYGRVEIADLLIKSGARVNVGADQETDVRDDPEHQQVPGSNDSGSDLDASRTKPWSIRAPPLHRAAWRGHTNVVSLLLRAGAIVDARRAGTTALQEAAARGHTDTVKRLLEAGADVNAGAGGLGTPVLAALKSGHFEVAKFLIAFASAEGTPLSV